MEPCDLKSFIIFIVFAVVSKVISGKDITLSVYTVTSKSVTVKWSAFPGASSYKITATPKNSPEYSAFSQFSGDYVIGSIISLTPNTIYVMEVEAMDNAFNVLSRAEVEETTAPDVPGVAKAYSKHSDSITVEFSRMHGATSYILRAEAGYGQFFSEIEVSDSPGTVLGLQPHTEYELSVMSVNKGGRSQPSLPRTAKTVVASPQLVSSSPDSGTILVHWAPVENAILYTLCVIMEGSSMRLKHNTTDLSMAFTDLEPGTTYCIKGNAWDVDGSPGDDYTVCQITRPATAVVSQIILNSAEPQGLVVYWRPARGADYYRVVSSTQQECTSYESHCTIGPVSCGQNHTITVTAVNEAGHSEASEAHSFITFPCPPQTLWVEEPEPGQCSVLWNEMAWAGFYMTFVKRDDGAEEFCNTTGLMCSYACECGFTYFMNVFAHNKAGSSPPGPVLNYTTIPCCPKDVSVSLVSADTLEIFWSPMRGAEVYETMAAGVSDVVLCNDTASLCALSNLRCNTKYQVVVRPCGELSGCNNTCKPHTGETAPCTPMNLRIAQVNTSYVNVSWSAMNTGAEYTVNLVGRMDSRMCRSTELYCEVPYVPCGSIYEVSAIARTSAGMSLPSYTVPLETAPCCPRSLKVMHVTQAITNVSWSPAAGAKSFVTSLASTRGEAKCHTLDTHCLMGCITCGTNYTVALEAISASGHKSLCTYHGFSSSPCCPLSVRLYRMTSNTIRVYWHSTSALNNYVVDLYGTVSNYTCVPRPDTTHCDVPDITCGDVYTVVVAPLSSGGVKVKFCPKRMYSVSCSGSNVGMELQATSSQLSRTHLTPNKAFSIP